jgi:hypothetical protein
VILNSNFDDQQTHLCLLNESSILADALGVFEFIAIIDMNWSHFVVLLKSNLDFQRTGLNFKSDLSRTPKCFSIVLNFVKSKAAPKH